MIKPVTAAIGFSQKMWPIMSERSATLVPSKSINPLAHLALCLSIKSSVGGFSS